jgi:hypothetical protein
LIFSILIEMTICTKNRKFMTDIHSIIGIFPSNEEADTVVLELQKKGFDIKKLSLLKTIIPPNIEGADFHPPHPAGIQPPHPEGMQPPYHPMGIQPPHLEGVQPPVSERVEPLHPEGVQLFLYSFLARKITIFSSWLGLSRSRSSWNTIYSRHRTCFDCRTDCENTGKLCGKNDY